MRRYLSETKDHSGGALRSFRNWIPDRGPSNRPLQIVGLELCADLNVDVATAAIQGEDLWKYFDSIKVFTKDGRIVWDANGEASRLEAILRVGPLRFREHADVGTGTGVTVNVRCFIPCAIPRAKLASDFELPAYLLEKVEVKLADNSTLDIGSSAVTINSGSVYVNAWCREIDSLALPVPWEFKTASWSGTDEQVIAVNGALLYSAFVYANGASGGASLAGFDDHRIDGLIEHPWDEVDAMFWQTWARGESKFDGSTVGNPVFGSPFSAATPSARLLWGLADGESLRSCPYIPGDLTIRATNSVSSLITGYTVLHNRSKRTSELAARKFGIPESAWRVHTRKGSRRNPSRWGGRAAFMPLRAPDPRTAS